MKFLHFFCPISTFLSFLLCWSWHCCVCELTICMQPYIAFLSTPQCSFTTWGNWCFRTSSYPASTGTCIEEELVCELPKTLQGFVDFQSHSQAVICSVPLPLAAYAQMCWPLQEKTLAFSVCFLSTVNLWKDYVSPWLKNGQSTHPCALQGFHCLIQLGLGLLIVFLQSFRPSMSLDLSPGVRVQSLQWGSIVGTSWGTRCLRS